jgi:hypothetical protein
MPIGFGLDYLCQPLLIAVAHYQPDPLDATDLHSGPLHIAASGDNQCFGVTAMGQPQQITTLAVSDMGYSACVKQINISGMVRGNYPVTSIKELASQRLRLCLIELAT